MRFLVLLIGGVLDGLLKFLLRILEAFKTPTSDPRPPELPLWKLPVVGHLPYVAYFRRGSSFGEAINKVALLAKSSIIRTKLGAFNYVFLNNTDAVKEVLRSEKCSDRRKIMVLDMCFKDGPTSSNGERWRKLKSFGVKALRRYGPGHPKFNEVLDEEVINLLKAVLPLDQIHVLSEKEKNFKASFVEKILSNPLTCEVNFKHHLKAACINAMLWVFTHRRLDLLSGEAALLASTVTRLLGTGGEVGLFELFPSTFSVLPDWVTGVSMVKRHKQTLDAIFLPIIMEELATRKAGKPRHALDQFADEFLGEDVQDGQEIPDRLVKEEVQPSFHDFVCSGDIPGYTLAWCLVYAAAHPWAAVKIQEEIDNLRLVPGEFPAYMQHHEMMPYTIAFMCEAMRMGTPAPLLVERLCSETCRVAGCTIEKDTCIIPNVYQCHREMEYWPHPTHFWPERFLAFDNEGRMSFRPNANLMVFGAGKRKCVGENISWHVMFKMLTGILSLFDLDLQHVDRGNALKPDPSLPYISTPKSTCMTVRTRNLTSKQP